MDTRTPPTHRPASAASAGVPLFRHNPTAPAPAPTPQALAANPALPAPEALHPALWRAHQLGRGTQAQEVLPSGHLALDAQLPGGGWPLRELTELLLPHPGVGELRLLAPALATVQRQARSLMWFDPPAEPCPWALGALGIDVRQIVVVRGSQPPAEAAPRAAGLRPRRHAGPRLVPAATDTLWALEQALKSGHIGAVLAWLPDDLPADALRRLQLAAQAHDGPVFLLRSTQQRSRPSAAPLRLMLSSSGPDELRVAVLKRRGPPLAQPLNLALPAVLSASAYARAQLAAAALAEAPAATALPQARKLAVLPGMAVPWAALGATGVRAD